jgi:hypothetical protein
MNEIVCINSRRNLGRYQVVKVCRTMNIIKNALIVFITRVTPGFVRELKFILKLRYH